MRSYKNYSQLPTFVKAMLNDRDKKYVLKIQTLLEYNIEVFDLRKKQ